MSAVLSTLFCYEARVKGVFSERSSFDTSEHPLAARRSGRSDVLDLTEANPTRVGFAVEHGQLTEALTSTRNRDYLPDPLGSEDARRQLEHDLRSRGLETRAEHMFLTASTSEAYSFLFKVLCDPGDEVLIPSPSYPLFDYLARLEGVNVKPYPLGFDGVYYYDASEVELRVSPRTKAVVVVSPNNPTGTYIRARELDRLLDLGIPVISDEVFDGYALERPHDAVSATSAKRSLTFSLFGLSKQAALPQMKLAWTCAAGAPPLVAEAMTRLDVVGDTFLSTSTPVVNALPRLLGIGADMRAAIVARAKSNLNAARSAFQDSVVSCLPVEGGVYLVLRIPNTEPDEEVALGLLDRQGVYVHPGSFFGFADGAFLVVSLLTENAVFTEGVRRIRAFFHNERVS